VSISQVKVCKCVRGDEIVAFGWSRTDREYEYVLISWKCGTGDWRIAGLLYAGFCSKVRISYRSDLTGEGYTRDIQWNCKDTMRCVVGSYEAELLNLQMTMFSGLYDKRCYKSRSLQCLVVRL
jgi:hypothetical protein